MTTPVTKGVLEIVSERVGKLQRGYLADRPASVAALARLRRAAGKPTGTMFDILEHTHAEEFVVGRPGDEPTYAENAAHTALTLYAVHQQSQRQGMHHYGWGLGRSTRALIPEGTPRIESPVVRRFATLGTADSYSELTHHLRGVVQLLRAQQVRLDYGRLALDLLLWQMPEHTSHVRLRWGRDFHFPPKNN
ncbi:type I-E CRISPR-associated protein Cse2/CasB [Actinokineospora globicatena]|uniref:CRISPR system Cascade subunit CasB n=1 Tax=Actinokineospora globicatena TaxID=103729 RepID=A0A9W6QJJ0_9PSEU|nr:type I-E CRISPR-associated protein Cse2/CasB [Actinokineospora globicatena]GLW89752.1 hypothetical protein Aglo03_05680 [Actinokineospora globicatena]